VDFGPATYGLGLLAGLLSTLSPCVLPILPILVGSAAAAHPRAPLALAGGLALSYAVLGTLLARSGALLGLDPALLRSAGGVLLGGIGLVLLAAPLQRGFAAASAGIGNAGNALLERVSPQGLRGQFAIGLLLGLVWTPCVGPTLGAAVVLASRGTDTLQVALLMTLFGLGAAAPLVAVAQLSRSALTRARPTLLQSAKAGKLALGAALLLLSVLMLSGADRHIESWLIDHSPAWLGDLTTRY
jgi:cytochrome c biogenesis protein CcdA